MNLQLESIVQTIRETATHLGHKLIFNYEIGQGKTAPTSVSVQLIKLKEDGSVDPANTGMANLTVSNASFGGNYPRETPDQLIADIKTKAYELIDGGA